MLSRFEFQASTITTLANASARTTTFSSPVLDLRPFDGDLLVLQNVGTVSGTTPSLAGVLEDSDDGSTGWATIAGASFVAVTAANNSQKLVQAINAARRYVRYTGTITGTSPSFTFCVLALARGKSV